MCRPSGIYTFNPLNGIVRTGSVTDLIKCNNHTWARVSLYNPGADNYYETMYFQINCYYYCRILLGSKAKIRKLHYHLCEE